MFYLAGCLFIAVTVPFAEAFPSDVIHLFVLLLLPLVSVPNPQILQDRGQQACHLLSSRSVWCQVLGSRISSTLSQFFTVNVLFHSSACGHPVLPAPFISATVLLPRVCSWLRCRELTTIYARAYVWAFYPVPSISVCVFMPVPYRWEYCSFVIQLVANQGARCLQLFTSSFLWLLGSFVIPYRFQNCLFSV